MELTHVRFFPRRFPLIAASLFLLAAPAPATTVIPPDFATLVGQAQLIFSGEVINVQCEWVGQGKQRHIESNVSFKVLKPLKGRPGEVFVLNMLGGTVGEQRMEIAGAPGFKKSDRSIVFVENNGTQIVPLVGMMHGCYRMIRDSATGEEVMRKHDDTPLAGTEEIDERARNWSLHQAHGSPANKASLATTAKKPMKRVDFESAIERQLASNKK